MKRILDCKGCDDMIETGMVAVREEVLGTEPTEDDYLKAYVCPHCMCDDASNFKKLMEDIYGNFVCYGGFGDVQYRVRPWYCRNCGNVFTTWIRYRNTSIFPNLLVLLMIAGLSFLPILYLILGLVFHDGDYMFVAGISALSCYTYDSIFIAHSCRKRKKEPKDIEIWIRDSIKNNSNLSSELHIIRRNEKTKTERGGI